MDESESVKKGWGYEYDKGEDLFGFWSTAPSGMFKKSSGGVTDKPTMIPAEIAVEDKKIVAVPRWEDGNFTGKDVFNWWIN